MSSNPQTSLKAVVPPIFQEVQKTTTNHRKLAIKLLNVHVHCSDVDDFNFEFIRNVNKILPLKQGIKAIENVVKFIDSYVKFCHEAENDDNFASRFTQFLLEHLLKGIEANDKNVRFHVCQLIGLLISSTETINDNLYERLKSKLVDRLIDRESSVRVKAVEACAKLQDDNEIRKNIIERFHRVMRNDPNAKVRRAALLNIEFSKVTLPYVLERVRDFDAGIRRDVFMRIAELENFRVLTIEHREKLLKSGLRDSDPQVRKACSDMLVNKWFEQVSNNVLELLERIDVVGSEIAQDVLLEIFKSRPDTLQTLKFDEPFWENLTVESVFLARVFCEFTRNNKNRLDDHLPEITKFALYIQKFINLMNRALENEQEYEQINYEFIVCQLLLISMTLDYGDEIGRQQMFNLLRKVLKLNYIPVDHIENIVEILKKTSINERDFTDFMVEILSDIQENDQIMDELTSTMSNLKMSSSNMMMNKSSNTDLSINLKCLYIVRSILKKNVEILSDNPTMHGLLNDYIIPNIQHSEPLLRELSIQCLGLICLLDKQLANENLILFMQCVKHGHLELQNIALTSIFDILMVHRHSFIEKMNQDNQIFDFLYDCLHHENLKIQAIAVEGVAKLMYSNIIYEKKVLKELVILYFNIKSATNNHIQQCLNCFFPAYCYSSARNQSLLLQIFIPSLVDLINEYKQLENEEMIPPLQIAQQLIDWIDPLKLKQNEEIDANEREKIDTGIHADIAIEIIKELFVETNKDVRKLYCQILNKLNVDESAGIIRFKKLTLLTGNLKRKKPLGDKFSSNLLKKFEESLLHYYNEAPDPLDDNELEQLKDILNFIRTFQDTFPERITRSRSKMQEI